MKAILLVLFACACVVDFEHGSLPGDPSSFDDGLDTEPEPNGGMSAQLPCTSNCYTIIVNDSYLNGTRSDGSPWDGDGSLPELFVAVKVGGQPIGMTSTLASSQLTLLSSNLYRARWNEAIALVALFIDDQFDVAVYDNSGYLIGDCSYKIAARHLGVQTACLKENASIYVTFVSEVMP